MNSKINLLLNIKPAEAKVVKQLFLVQFFLGVATAFLFTSTLAMFLHTFQVKELPKVYLLSAGLLLVANAFYAKLEARLSAKKLLQTIIVFSTASILVTWAAVSFFAANWLPFALSALNMVVYMLVGYAFWGMAAIIFNVRESKRLFSVVGSGDIPAKLMGYSAVSVLAPLLGVENLLWFSVGGFVLAFYFLRKFEHQAISGHGHSGEHGSPHTDHGHHQTEEKSIITTYFQNHLIFSITIFSLLAFTVSSLIDYTLLAEVKSRFTSSPELATFIGVFFAVGRVLALLIKVVFSSRVISRLGLTNALLISPVVLLLLSAFMLLPGESEKTILYTFGIMVLLSEVLKSAVQEPAFFVLFQPLDPHSRLRGHLISKGYTMPFALLASGTFLAVYKHFNGGIGIVTICQILVGLVACWILSVFLIKKEYLHTLIHALRKGYFTGSELFLNDEPVRNLLVEKLNSQNPKEVILALELLERSGYRKLEKQLLPLLQSPFAVVRKYVLSRVVELRLAEAFPLIEQHLNQTKADKTRPDFIKAFFYLSPQLHPISENEELAIQKAALSGLSLRAEPEAHQQVLHYLQRYTLSENVEENLAVLEILSLTRYPEFLPFLATLLQHPAGAVYKRAIETAGKIGVVSLLPQVLETAQARKASYSLQKALLQYGDPVFAESLTPDMTPAELRKSVVKAASKIKGEHSTAFLFQWFKTEPHLQDDIIEALWSKNAALQPNEKQEVEAWLKTRLEAIRHKAVYCQVLLQERELQLLANSLASEVKQDLRKEMKSLALAYDRTQINRVMDLLDMGEPDKVANAIEMLEHQIPKKYFLPLEALLDFQLDKEKPFMALGEKRQWTSRQIIEEIMTTNAANCSEWVRSVACYSILNLPGFELTEVLSSATTSAETKDLYSETYGFVLTQLTKTAHVID